MISAFLKYVDCTWIGELNVRMEIRKPPTFPHILWNKHEATLLNEKKTNNICEGFNHAFDLSLPRTGQLWTGVFFVYSVHIHIVSILADNKCSFIYFLFLGFAQRMPPSRLSCISRLLATTVTAKMEPVRRTGSLERIRVCSKLWSGTTTTCQTRPTSILL
jgi:hypothetical protein